MKNGDLFFNKKGCEAVVINYENSRNVTIRFTDDNAHEMTLEARDLSRGAFKNPYFPSLFGVAYVGHGDFETSEGGKKTDEYIRWSSMIRRCYSEYVHDRQPSYSECTVSDDWLCYQSFAKWISNNEFNSADYELDKDLLLTGNKVYSSENCCLVPKTINSLVNDHSARKRLHPMGVSLDKRSGRFASQLAINGKLTSLGVFATAEEAHAAYVLAKEAYVKRMATEWRGRIDERVFEALMKWRVK